MRNAFRYLALVVIIASLVLTGCTNKTKDSGADGAGIEDRGVNADEMQGSETDTQTHGVADSAGFQGSELDDPDSLTRVRTLYFEYDSSEVRAEYRGAVQAHANYLATNPGASVTLEGHADERGSREYNLALGERRANAVRRQLVLLGASAGQIRTTSYGEEQPANEGHDESAWSENRRVEVIY